MYWRRASIEKILIYIKAPDQIYRTLNLAISIFRWCVFFLLLPLKMVVNSMVSLSTMELEICCQVEYVDEDWALICCFLWLSLFLSLSFFIVKSKEKNGMYKYQNKEVFLPLRLPLPVIVITSNVCKRLVLGDSMVFMSVCLLRLNSILFFVRCVRHRLNTQLYSGHKTYLTFRLFWTPFFCSTYLCVRAGHIIYFFL